MNEAIRMQVSAFVDGELPENEAELLVRRLSQDSLLRQQVAEFLAIGRVMRGEHTWVGVDELRMRIAAELEAAPLPEEAAGDVEPSRPGLVRPLTGVAIAATVALVAIFGLRQTIGLNGDVPEVPVVAGEGQPETVPTMSDEERHYLRLHGDASAEFGANSFKTRWTAAQMRVDELDVGEVAEEEARNEAEEESAARPDQP